MLQDTITLQSPGSDKLQFQASVSGMNMSVLRPLYGIHTVTSIFETSHQSNSNIDAWQLDKSPSVADVLEMECLGKRGNLATSRLT